MKALMKTLYNRRITIVLLALLWLSIHLLFASYLNTLSDFVNFKKMVLIKDNEDKEIIPDNNTKYILAWSGFNPDFFPKADFKVNNCLFTENKLYLEDYKKFDAILFNADDLSSKNKPVRRSKKQIYIFSSKESAYNKPACEVFNDHFYNWTFTYRTDSTIPWYYFVVRNLSHSIIAPSKTLVWQTSYQPISEEIKGILAQKKRTAAWIVNYCEADSLRNDYLSMLQKSLNNYSLKKIDVFGDCSGRICEGNNCDEMLKRNYYFYMAFESSLAEDYVTEKVLFGFRNYAVPIVYGGADYSRFLPKGSYINAREHHPAELAYIISEALKNPNLIEEYHRWRNLYTVDSNSASSTSLENLCKALNGDIQPKEAIGNFRVWWNGLNGMKWCLSDEYWKETAKVNQDASHIFQMYDNKIKLNISG